MEATSYLRFILSLVLVLGMIFAALWAVRRWGLGAMMPRMGGGRRLALVEALPLDGKHRLVLVRRDDREHLLLLGGGGDTVVERDCPPARFKLPAGQTETAP